MKHGPIALLDDSTPVVCVATDSPVLEKVVSNMQEVRARGAHVIAITTTGNTEVTKHADAAIAVPADRLDAAADSRGDPPADARLRDRTAAGAERRSAPQPRQDGHRRVGRSHCRAFRKATSAAVSSIAQMTLPDWLLPLLDAEQMRAIDRWAIDEQGVPSLDLMERAGAGVPRRSSELVPDGPVAVVCGKGNNGGDGLVVARLLREAGRPVTVLCTAPLEELSGDAAANLARLPGAPPLSCSAGASGGDPGGGGALRSELSRRSACRRGRR